MATVEEKVGHLMRHLRLLEFNGNMRRLLEFFVKNNQQDFTLPYWKHFGADTVKYLLHFEKHDYFDIYWIPKYEATLKKELLIPEEVIAGVNTKDLAVRMAKVDWKNEYYDEVQGGFNTNTQEGKIQAALVPGIMHDLQKLGDACPTGEKLQAAFMYKYWYETPFEIQTPQTEALKHAQEFSATISPRSHITAYETYLLLNAKALKTLNNTVMNNENLKFLSDNLKYAGFGEDLQIKLERAMREGKPEFQLQFSTEFNKKPFEATLNFRKSDTSDMYFFNNYNASLVRNDGQKMEQTFYLNKGKGVTAKEAFNLLDGRAVHKDLVTKEGQPYKAWLQLNPEVKGNNGNMKVEQMHEKYGYNLTAAVSKFAVAELADSKKSDELMASLKKGNMQSVTIEKDGSAHKMFLEADPRFKTVKLYDAQMKLVAKDDLSRYQSVGQGQAVKSVNEKEAKDEKKEISHQKKPDKEKVQKAGKSLLPKKRESTKKGLGIA